MLIMHDTMVLVSDIDSFSLLGSPVTLTRSDIGIVCEWSVPDDHVVGSGVASKSAFLVVGGNESMFTYPQGTRAIF